MTDLEDTSPDASGPSRRRVAQAAGWSVPLVIAAVGAPAAQASTPPAEPFDGLTGVWGPLSFADTGVGSAAFTVTNTSQGVLRLGTIMFTPTDNNSLRFLLVGGQGDWSAVQGALASSTYINGCAMSGGYPFQPGQSVRFDCSISYGATDGTLTVAVIPFDTDGVGTPAPLSFATLDVPLPRK